MFIADACPELRTAADALAREPDYRGIMATRDFEAADVLNDAHVSMVIWTAPYEFIARHYRRPLVVAGFEPLDILHSIWLVLKQMSEGRCEIENQYGRVAPPDGNPAALDAIARVFELRAFFEWRGLGSIDHSGVRMRSAYARYDAERKFAMPALHIADPKSRQRGEVLKGVIKPWQCKVFGAACTPEAPLGALMVSSERACAAYYQYGDLEGLRSKRAADAA